MIEKHPYIPGRDTHIWQHTLLYTITQFLDFSITELVRGVINNTLKLYLKWTLRKNLLATFLYFYK